MPVPHYKVWEWGDPVGKGAMSSCYVGVSGVAKPAKPQQPYAVANEVVCGALARVLHLPCPPGFIVERDGTPYHVSLDFNLAGEDLPPADAEAVIERFPELSWGILLFDVWVVNGDRHNQNLSYDKSREKVQIFDHSHAFLSGKKGAEHLKDNEDSLGIGENGTPKHCLAREVAELHGIDGWSERIRSVPEYYIRETVENAVSVGLPEEEADFCADFLIDRQDRVKNLVEKHKKAFPKLDPDLWAQAAAAEEADDAKPGDEPGDAGAADGAGAGAEAEVGETGEAEEGEDE